MTIAIVESVGGALAWRFEAACRGAPPGLFVTDQDGDARPDDEPTYPTAEHRRYCDPCSVRTQCLTWALAHGEVGVWGGTTSYQRRQLRRPRPRDACPGCGADAVVPRGVHEVCLACGVSWRAA